MSYTVKISENENAVLKIVQDADSSMNPRIDFDNFGHMICWHSRYNLGDDHNFSSPREFLEEHVLRFNEDDLHEIEEKSNDDLLNTLQDHMVILPLYLYDHSGITMNTTGFSCRWDSGQVGWVYATNEEVISEYGNLDIEKAEKLLKAEVEVYDQYIRGEVYGYILEKKVKCECCNSIEYENIDSCWGFLGEIDYIESELVGYLGEEYKDLINGLEWAN